MRSIFKYIRRLSVFVIILTIAVLPAVISKTFSISNDSTYSDDLCASTPATQINESRSTDGNPAPYPCDISESEDNGVRKVIKTYELNAEESPDVIPKTGFVNGGWQYDFMEITKKNIADCITKDYSVSVTVDSGTKDIDEIMCKLEPTVVYSSTDGYSGLLTLDISSIMVVNQLTDYEDEDDTGQDSSGAGYYRTTAVYKGTVSKLMNEKTVYSAYFTGIKITPTPTPVPEPQEAPSEPPKILPIVIIMMSFLSAISCLVFFILSRSNVKVYSLYEETYVLIGHTRVGFTYPIINLTPFAQKSVSGSFILILNSHLAKRLTGKTVTINYGGKSLQHIVQRNEDSYHIAVDF